MIAMGCSINSGSQPEPRGSQGSRAIASSGTNLTASLSTLRRTTAKPITVDREEFTGITFWRAVAFMKSKSKSPGGTAFAGLLPSRKAGKLFQ